MSPVIVTARWAAAQRARESERANHLFHDPLARALAGEEGMVALDLSEKYNPRHEDTARFIATRVRFFDDVALRCVAEGVRQIVLPAAGMDARAYRLPWPDGVALYEIDHPELLAMKEAILQRQAITAKCRRLTLGADLRAEWPHLLKSLGFVPDERSLWLAEGLLYYLEEPAVHGVLSEISKFAAPGSALVADLVTRSFLTNPWVQNSLKAMESRGMGWRFGSDDPSGLFAGYGWQVEIRRPNEESTRYAPERFPAPPDGEAAYGWSYFVVARRS